MVLGLDSFVLKWWATRAADLNSWDVSSNSAFSYNVMTFLCFLGALSASLVALDMGPVVSFRIYGIAQNNKKYMRTADLYCSCDD